MSDTPLGQVLTAASEILMREVGPEDDFFSAGGDSVAAVELVTELERMFHTEIDLELVLTQPDFAALATVLADVSAGRDR
ncbi:MULTISPECIES: phosphopantetheine-binding protein [unclassified Streptomyces]|uniref:phosphopantetheine-binding protein n=1 Tax=unclassified Streptomyces TaxID=2593676 RepID=UPI00343017BA